MRPNPKIAEFKKRSTPISYSSVVIDERGALQDRRSLLDQRIVAGYGSIWGNKNMHDEKFIKGAWKRSISDNGPQSSANYKIKLKDRHGKSVSLFSELKEDEVGLYFRTVPLDNVSWADDLLTQLKSGTLNNFSVGFRHNWDAVDWDEQDDCLIVKDARLFEISVVDTPSDMETSVVRSSETMETLNDEVEAFIINSIPRNMQVDARKIFTRCMTLKDEDSHEENRNALRNKKPSDVGLDLNYLINKL